MSVYLTKKNNLFTRGCTKNVRKLILILFFIVFSNTIDFQIKIKKITTISIDLLLLFLDSSVKDVAFLDSS